MGSSALQPDALGTQIGLPERTDWVLNILQYVQHKYKRNINFHNIAALGSCLLWRAALYIRNLHLRAKLLVSARIS
jgi:hypothetical protein